MKEVIAVIVPVDVRTLPFTSFQIKNIQGEGADNSLTIPFFFRCKIPWMSNDTFEIQNAEHENLINLTIPPATDDSLLLYDKCHLRHFNVNGTVTSPALRGNVSMVRCTEWVYDRSVFMDTFTSVVSLFIVFNFARYVVVVVVSVVIIVVIATVVDLIL